MTEVKKPWMETWTADVHSTSVILNFDDTKSGNCAECFMDDERARLAAAAPELYRALAAVEWIEEDEADVRCPACACRKPSHHARCVIDSALRKARGEH